MHILVIGGAGYIGSHVVKDLKKAGHQISIYDNKSTAISPVAKMQDILDYPELLLAMRQNVDAVVHLAAKKAVGESMENPQKYATNNIIGSINILNAMCECGVKNIVFSSSSAVYGNPEYLPIDENHPTKPLSFYGFNKLDIEQYLEWYQKLKGINFVALRYFNAVGYDESGAITGLENNPQNLLPIIIEAALGKRDKLTIFGNDYETPDGTCIRDYIHVSDLASAHLLALEYLQKEHKSQILNLGTKTGVSVLEMVQKTAEITGHKIPYEFGPRRAGDPGVVMAAAEKAETILGWKATHSSLQNIIESTWKMYHKQQHNN